MPDFMLLFRGGDPQQGARTPEDFHQHMAEWGQWVQGLHSSGVFEAGRSLQPTPSRVLDRRLTVTDGPFCEAKELIGGFVIVRAEDVEAATEIAKGCPVLAMGGEVEIRQLLPQHPG